jgi:hypothetical protein
MTHRPTTCPAWCEVEDHAEDVRLFGLRWHWAEMLAGHAKVIVYVIDQLTGGAAPEGGVLVDAEPDHTMSRDEAIALAAALARAAVLLAEPAPVEDRQVA